MRTITAAARNKLNSQYGTEPIIIVEVEWVEGGQRVAYADRKIADSVRGQIVEIGAIDSATKMDGSSDSTQVTLVLEDADGAIKALYDGCDFHKRPVWVYQWFDGLDLSDKFLLFKGQINTPVEWSEGDRTVRFDVTTQIEEVEAGFSMEEGDFPVVPPDALGKVWPLVFGSVCDVQAVQVRSPRYGVLQSGEGIHDYTLESRICQAKYISCPNVPAGEYNTLTGDADTGYGFQITQRWEPDAQCVEDRYFTICDLMYQLEQQLAYEHPTITILGATYLFPQHETITLNVDGGIFTGSFDGDVFTIESREHPDFETNPPGVCIAIPPERSFQFQSILGAKSFEQTTSGNTWFDGSFWGPSGDPGVDPRELDEYCNEAKQAATRSVATGGPVDSQKALDDMPTASFFWARAGSHVYLEAEAEVLYIVNLLPCTITRVAAMRDTDFGPKLLTVPEEWYTIYETDYDGYTVTEIGMTKPLSRRSEMVEYPDGSKKLEQSRWSDDLYITLTSSIGPNPVDIIEWLIGKYTAFTVDAASFDHVRARLANYPSQFALYERKNVMELVADIATQSRCVVYVRGDVVYLKYASQEPTVVATITESDVLLNSLKLSLSNTEDVATKHTITWQRNEVEGPLTLILKHNIAKYGTHDKEVAYYTQNIYENVLKSATFWMIRDANVWKLVEFSTPLKYLDLEVFDCVTLNLSDIGPVKAVIMSVNYDPADEQINFTCWTPLRAGETAPYVHAWPADIPAGTIFPTDEERALGMGYTFTVAPPAGHLLYTAREEDGNMPPVVTSGDEHPSDLDDALSSCFCPTDDDVYFDELDPKFVALKRAQKADQGQKSNAMNGGSGGLSDQGSQGGKGACGEAKGASCSYEVKITYCTPIDIQLCTADGSACNCVKIGHPCRSVLVTMCHSFGAPFSASMMYTSTKQDIEKNHCTWSCGVTRPYLVFTPKGIPGDGEDGGCQSFPGSPDDPNQVETQPPVEDVWGG